MTSEQKALELDLIARVIAAYRATCYDGVNHKDLILKNPHVREAINTLIASATEADKARHAAELREQAERFSEAAAYQDAFLAESGYDKSHDARQRLSPFILPSVDPIVEALEAAGWRNAEGDQKGLPALAGDIRAALDARGLAIVKKDATNEG